MWEDSHKRNYIDGVGGGCSSDSGGDSGSSDDKSMTCNYMQKKVLTAM
jgi:hypothetical protein